LRQLAPLTWYMLRPVTSPKHHEALDIPLAERVDYLMIIASMAGADVSIAPEELQKLRDLCSALQLPERESELILSTARRPTASIERHLDALKSSPLRFTLLSDCLSLAYADGEYAKSERKEIATLASALGVDAAQLSTLEECALSMAEAAGKDGDPHHWKKRSEELASRLVAVGIPIGAVATASAAGVAMTGLTTGVTALVVGLGIASGLGAILGLGVGTIVGIRWLHEKIGGAA
jgi:uncharacterized tellurite resistance protein B-like protein